MMTLEETISNLRNKSRYQVSSKPKFDKWIVDPETMTAVYNHLIAYRDLLQGMQDKGFKIVELAGKRTEIRTEPSEVRTGEKGVSHVIRDAENRLVCECGQGVERWYMYCYQCGRRLAWEDPEGVPGE